MIVGHGLSPVGHGEVGLHFGRGTKFFERDGVPEGMQGGNPAQEMCLRIARPGGGGKVDRAEFSELRRFMRRAVK